MWHPLLTNFDTRYFFILFIHKIHMLWKHESDVCLMVYDQADKLNIIGNLMHLKCCVEIFTQSHEKSIKHLN